MSLLKETTVPKDTVLSETEAKTELPKIKDTDNPIWASEPDTKGNPTSELSDILNSVFKSYGLIDNSADSGKSEKNESSNSEKYSDYLEKGEDGKYYDKETGKAYDSVEDWVKAQETLGKRYESTSKYYENKANKEWARFKNAEQNGETDAEKWEHYRKSQEYYDKAKECKEKADKIKEKIGKFNNYISSKAFSEKNDTTEEKSIAGAFDTLPIERQEAVYKSFENAPDAIKKIVNDLSEKLSVEDTEFDDCCHYSLVDKVIRMESELDDSEYAEIFSHEYGHLVDDMLDKSSSNPKFTDAIKEDLAKYDLVTEKGCQNFEQMMDELMSSDAAYDRTISDNMSAFFENSQEVVSCYNDEGIDYYNHSNEYWAIDGKREAEIFANTFSMMAQDNTASCEFMKKYFSNSWEQVCDILNGGI